MIDAQIWEESYTVHFSFNGKGDGTGITAMPIKTPIYCPKKLANSAADLQLQC